MNNDFVDYQNKKKEMIWAECSCGAGHFVFTKLQDCFSVCKKCHKKLYELNCKFCETGFCFPEDVKEIDASGNKWTCQTCKKLNDGLPSEEVTGYEKGEIPPEVWKEDDSRRLIPKWLTWVVIGLILAMYFSKYFR